MKLFNWLALPIFLLITPPAFAGYSCQDGENKLEVSSYWQLGLKAQFSSPEISEYYKKEYKLNVTTMESVLDPDTGKYYTETEENIHRFLVVAPNSGTDGIWGIELDVSNHKVRVADMAGMMFHFQMTCEVTPDLEYTDPLLSVSKRLVP